MAASAPPLPSSMDMTSTICYNAPAVIEWSDLTSEPRSRCYLAESDSSPLRLDWVFNEPQHVASFKIRLPFHLGQETSDKESEYLYIWTHPRNVIFLLQDPTHPRLESTAALRGPTTCLRLVLDKPVSILAPSDMHLPLPSVHSSLLRSLELLARQTVLAIHVDQCNVLDPETMQRACRAFTDGSVKQSPRYSLRGFYKGRGAKVLEHFTCDAGSPSESTKTGGGGGGGDDDDDVRNAANAANAVSLPPYPAAQAAPPPSLFARPAKKRKGADAGIDPPSVVDICADFVTRQQAQMGDFAMRQQLLARIGDEMRGMEGRVVKQLEKRLEDGLEKFEYELEGAIERSVDQSWEELRDTLREDCLNELKDDLEGGLVSIVLPR